MAGTATAPSGRYPARLDSGSTPARQKRTVTPIARCINIQIGHSRVEPFWEGQQRKARLIIARRRAIRRDCLGVIAPPVIRADRGVLDLGSRVCPRRWLSRLRRAAGYAGG